MKRGHTLQVLEDCLWVLGNGWQVMFSHRKEREELLEALVIRDEDFTPYNHYHQVSKEGTDRYNCPLSSPNLFLFPCCGRGYICYGAMVTRFLTWKWHTTWKSKSILFHQITKALMGWSHDLEAVVVITDDWVADNWETKRSCNA